MKRQTPGSSLARMWLWPGLLLALVVAGCAAPRTYDIQPQGERGPCTFYKVGEIRNVELGEVQRAMRRMGGDFVRSRADRPGGRSTYSAEIFRYHDPRCSRRD